MILIWIVALAAISWDFYPGALSSSQWPLRNVGHIFKLYNFYSVCLIMVSLEFIVRDTYVLKRSSQKSGNEKDET